MAEPQPVILIRNGTLVWSDGARLNEFAGWLAVEGERIADMGAGDPPAVWEQRAGRVIDARHMAVLPGLVNAHTHFSQTFMRGLGDDRSLMRWLKEIIFPAQDAMTPEDMHLASLLGLVENLRCGVTRVVQHHKLPDRARVAVTCEAAARIGLRMTLARGWGDVGASAEPLDVILSEMEWLADTWHQTPRSGGRISVASGPLMPLRCSDEGMREVTRFARARGLQTHIHLAETLDQIAPMLSRCGKRHAEWLASLDCLGPDTELVHTVHVTDAELDLIASSGATVVYCPTSNMYLASGAAPVSAMLRRGIPVALATDGPASNNSQDLLECAKVAALLAKHTTGDPQALLPSDVIRMMTLASATGGRLAAGVEADITIVDLNNTRCQPVHSAASAVVFNAVGADVHTVIVGGRILLDAGRITMLDEAALLEQCRAAAAALARRVGLRP